MRGDLFRRMVVAGRTEPEPGNLRLAESRLRLRHRLAAGDGYLQAGFTAVLQDRFVGEMLAFAVSLLVGRPLFVVVLVPRPEVVSRREASRAKKGYGPRRVALDHQLRTSTPRIGLRLDTSDRTPDRTVEAILGPAFPAARVD